MRELRRIFDREEKKVYNHMVPEQLFKQTREGRGPPRKRGRSKWENSECLVGA